MFSSSLNIGTTTVRQGSTACADGAKWWVIGAVSAGTTTVFMTESSWFSGKTSDLLWGQDTINDVVFRFSFELACLLNICGEARMFFAYILEMLFHNTHPAGPFRPQIL